MFAFSSTDYPSEYLKTNHNTPSIWELASSDLDQDDEVAFLERPKKHAGPKPVPTPITLLSLAGLLLLGSLDCSPMIFQQHHFLAGCATVDMKMQTPIIPMEMQFSDINSLPARGLTDCRPLISQQHQLEPSVGNAHFCLSLHQYKRTAWSERDRWKSTLKPSPPVANLQKWRRWRNKCEISLPTYRNSPGRTRSLIRDSCNTRLRSKRKKTRERVRKEVMLSLGKSNSKNNGKNNCRSNSKSNVKNKKGTDSPFTKMVISFPLPSKFRMPSLEIFDGSKDPLDHLESFKTVMCLQGVPDEIMCRAFPTTLKGPARKEGETLRSYLTRFNKETLLVDGADDKVVLTAFISGLQSGDFLFSVYKDPSSTMTEMMYEAQRYMNGEEALLARDQTTGKKRKGDHADRPAEPHETRPKVQRNRNRRQEDRSGWGFNERFNRFTPLNAPVNHIFMQIRNDPALKWPGKLLTDPDKRPRDKYCCFHRDHGHNTEDCYNLKRQIEELIKQGKLQRFVEKGGTSRSSRKAYARQIHNVLVTQKSNKKPRVEDLPITFTEEDACKVFHPHDDALVVTMEIAGYSTRRVLIDNGSSADIIYLTAFQQMKIDKDQLQPIETPLGTHPKQATKKVDFLVVDCPSAYNVIIGCPTLNRLRAVTSTYHLLVRFPTENGIGEMKGDQAMAKECYLTTVNAERVHQMLIVEERQNIAEPTEELEEIVLIEGDEKKITRIGTSMAKEIRASVVSFLRGNADVFAWSHDDMPGISTEVISHKLNVNPSTPPVKQKRRVFAPERNTAVMEEVDKLLKAGFIREVYYPEWLANVLSPSTNRPTSGFHGWTQVTQFHGRLLWLQPNSDDRRGPREDGLHHQQMPFLLEGRNVEVYVDNMQVKSKKDEDHLIDLKETFQTLRRYNMKLNLAKCVFGVSSRKFLGFMVSQRGIEANPDKIKAIIDMSPPKTVKEAFQWTEECQKAFEELKAYLSSPPLLSPSQTGEELYLYLAVSASAVSSALIREEERIQKPVYYTSRALKGAAMNKPDVARRLVQWSIEMSEFHIDYRPRTAIKAQALANFIAEFTQPWKDEGELEEGEAWTVNIDGSSTKEMSGAGVVLVSPEKDKFEYALQLRFCATNNEAEYEALLAGLKLAKSVEIENLTVKSDSQLIVGQVKGEYEAKEDRMKRYLTVVKNLLTQFKKVELLQIPREENEAADRLARLASSGVEIDGFVEIQGRPSTEEETINPISFTTTWMLPIIRYLKEGTLPADRAEAHKLPIRASRFQLLGGILYKMGFSRPHLRCLSPEEANYVIREVHEGVCGNHSGARSLAHKLTRAGYYWPSLLHDATQFVKACDKCQRFANVPRVPPEEFTPITSPWPFAQWGLDIMGPFPVGTKQAKFLVVAIDYFTKWVEAEPLATISKKNVKSFVWKAVICRFGIPRVLISDNGKQFDNGPFRELCAQLNIKNHYSSPRHPQANGQVEVTNRTLLKQIKTWLEGAKSMWVEELPRVLWAYRTTIRTPTKETPFKLTFGAEVVIPVEIGLTTLRTTFHKEGENEGQLRLNLDLLDETRERAARRITLYQGRMARYYNAKVKLRRFEVGDWVLRKVTQATKDPSQGKLGPNWEGPYKIIQYYRRGTYHMEDRHGKKLPHLWNAEHLKKYYPRHLNKLDTHEVQLLDTFKVHKLDTHEVQLLDTFKVHKLDTHEVQLLDTFKVHKLDTHEVQLLDTFKVHKSDTYEVQVLDTHEVQVLDTFTVHKSDTHEVQVLDTFKVHRSDTHEVQVLDTFKVHKLDTHEVQLIDIVEVHKSDTHEVPVPWKPIKKIAPLLINRR
uniref:Uncharacterized protein n=1 Tax=Fagus sylvatica TaxID=28930 RepID=A0A2N9H5N8_FAGSY